MRSSFDVAKQLGHRSSKLVDDTYGHAVEDPVYRRELRYGVGRDGASAAGAVPDPAARDGEEPARGAATPPPERPHLPTPGARAYLPRA